MSGLEVLGAISAALSIVKAATHLIERVQQRREFTDHVDSALEFTEMLLWRWRSLRQVLQEAREDGLNDPQLAAHERNMDKKLLEASNLAHELLNCDRRTVNIQIMLGMGVGKLQRLTSRLHHLVVWQDALQGVVIGWSTTQMRRRLSRSVSLPPSPLLDKVVEIPMTTPVFDRQSTSLSRTSTLVDAHPRLQRSQTEGSSSPAEARPIRAAMVILERQANELVLNGVEVLRTPNVILVYPNKTETLLHWLIKRSMAEPILHLIRRRGVDINAADSFDVTPLYHAVNMVHKEKAEIVRAMVRRGARFCGMKPKIMGNDIRNIVRYVN